MRWKSWLEKNNLSLGLDVSIEDSTKKKINNNF